MPSLVPHEAHSWLHAAALSSWLLVQLDTTPVLVTTASVATFISVWFCLVWFMTWPGHCSAIAEWLCCSARCYAFCKLCVPLLHSLARNAVACCVYLRLLLCPSCTLTVSATFAFGKSWPSSNHNSVSDTHWQQHQFVHFENTFSIFRNGTIKVSGRQKFKHTKCCCYIAVYTPFLCFPWADIEMHLKVASA